MSGVDFIDPERYRDIPAPPDVERAWAAGFFDGEGWIGAQRVKNAYYLRLVVVQTETTTLERFQAATGGHGKIYPRSRNQPTHWSPGWCFQVNALGDLTYAVNLLWPYLSGPKRLQIEAAFAKRAAYRESWPAEFPLPQQKISDEAVRGIRAALAEGGQTQRAIAAEFGISDYHVSKIKHGKRRRSVR
jgi:hypothetical protein